MSSVRIDAAPVAKRLPPYSPQSGAATARGAPSARRDAAGGKTHPALRVD